MDGDDLIEEYAVEHCLDYIEQNSTNAVIFGFSQQEGDTIASSKSVLNGTYRDKEIRDKILPLVLGLSFDDINRWIRGNKGLRDGKESPGLWHILCDGETIRRNGLRFDENLAIGEDLCFFCTYLLYESSVGYLNEHLYTYIRRMTGASLQSKSNVMKRLHNKEKLMSVRSEIDKLSYKLYGINTHEYWEGTIVLSCIQMALCLSKNEGGTIKENFRAYKEFISKSEVKTACDNFRPAKGMKSIPFRLISIGRVKYFYI